MKNQYRNVHEIGSIVCKRKKIIKMTKIIVLYSSKTGNQQDIISQRWVRNVKTFWFSGPGVDGVGHIAGDYFLFSNLLLRSCLWLTDMRLLSAIAGAFLLVVALTADAEADSDTERRHPCESLFAVRYKTVESWDGHYSWREKWIWLICD